MVTTDYMLDRLVGCGNIIIINGGFVQTLTQREGQVGGSISFLSCLFVTAAARPRKLTCVHPLLEFELPTVRLFVPYSFGVPYI